MHKRRLTAPVLTGLAVLLAVCLVSCGQEPAGSAAPQPTTAPVVAAPISPQPGAALRGAIETGDKAGSGEIAFTVTDDGKAITSLSITLTDVKCDGLSASRYHDWFGSPPFPVTDAKISTSLPAMGGEVENYKMESSPFDLPAVDDLSRAGQIEGQFTTPTRASGTIHIYLGVLMTKAACELGTFPWTASAP